MTLHSTLAFRTACHMTSSAADAEDAVQEAFVKAYSALARFDPDRPFRPWLLRIVANEARNRARGQGRRAAAELRAAAWIEQTQPIGSVEGQVLANEARGSLLRSLQQCPAEDRLVITCRYLLDLSIEETAAVVGVAAGTVKSRCSRALDRLRTVMGVEHA